MRILVTIRKGRKFARNGSQAEKYDACLPTYLSVETLYRGRRATVTILVGLARFFLLPYHRFLNSLCPERRGLTCPSAVNFSRVWRNMSALII